MLRGRRSKRRSPRASLWPRRSTTRLSLRSSGCRPLPSTQQRCSNMASEAILAVLAIIEQIIPLLGTSAATASMIVNIINALTQLLPFIVNEVSTVYTSVKNIISLLQNSGQVTAEQTAALQQLDAQVDAAWAAVLPQIDPDAAGGDPGAAHAS